MFESEKSRKIAKILFWYFCLPLTFCFLLCGIFWKVNLFDSVWFVLSLLLGFPWLAMKSDDQYNKTFNETVEEFRQMTRKEFEEVEIDIRKCFGRHGAVFKEAYKKVWKERFGSDIRTL